MPEPVSRNGLSIRSLLGMHRDALARVQAIAAQQDGVITHQQALECGISWSAMRSLIRTGRWLRVTRGVYLIDADLHEGVPRRAVLRAALQRHGSNAVFWGATAAEVLQIAGVVGWPGKPWVMLPFDEAKPPDPDARLRFRVPNLDETVVVDGFPVTIPARTLADAVPLFDRPTGLSLLDSALHTGQIDVGELAVVAAMAAGRRGAPKVRELIGYADGRAMTPLESRVRLCCIDGDLPPDELQWPVRDAAGVLLGFGDMAWFRKRRRPLIGEADGEIPHSEGMPGSPPPVFRDRRRGNDFTAASADTLRFTWLDTKTPAYIRSTVRKALDADAA